MIRHLIARPFFKLGDALITLARLAQLLGFCTLHGRDGHAERDAHYRTGLTQAHFRISQQEGTR
jgi:hypothetical protein